MRRIDQSIARAFWFGVASVGSLLWMGSAAAESFQFPTGNRALLEADGGPRFYVETTGNTWETGGFGCIRTDGKQFHEGIDIRCLTRTASGEPADKVRATAEGVVAYVNDKPSLSNYGRYVVLRHQIDGMEVFSLYAHLSAVAAGLKPGKAVKAGEQIAVMGRSANTAEGITKARAHVHFELNLFISDKFPDYYKVVLPKERNDHGLWNGLNLAGLDPSELLKRSSTDDTNFHLADWIRHQPELCRVMVRKTAFSWLRRYPMLVNSNPRATAEGVAGYEVVFNFNGVAIQLTPKAEAELTSKQKVQLISVNEAEVEAKPCRNMLVRRGGKWELTQTGLDVIALLTQ